VTVSPTLAGAVLLLAAIVALQFAATAVGYALAMSSLRYVPFWPQAGSLLALLLACERRAWPLIVTGAVLGEVAAGLRFDGNEPVLNEFAYAGVRAVEIMGAAMWLQLVFDSPELLVRMRNVVAFLLFPAAVSLVGAAVATLLTFVSTGIWESTDLQLWWVADYLGIVLFAPIVLNALRPGVLPPTFARVHAWEAPLQLAVLALVSQIAFGGTAEPSNLVEVPYIVYPVLVWMAVRARPAQLVLIALLVVAFVAAFHTAAGRGPFAYSHLSAFGTLISAQVFLIVTTLTTLLLVAAVFERRHAIIAAHASDAGYRSFVRNSHDAIWRVEIDPPMPVSAPSHERARRLWEHARIAEHNDAYARLGGTRRNLPRFWREDKAWYEACTELLLSRPVVVDGGIEAKLRLPVDGDERITLCELSCVVEAQALTRVWGAAMDITAQERTQAALESQRAELRSLTSQLMLAEENARRKTAADLHDGIGQNLSAIMMWQARVREQAGEVERAELLDNIRMAAMESLQWTRAIIADLSPPGLYDMGLESALNWLVGRVRERHALDIVVERCELPPGLALETKVTLFQCIRELLSNVVKHAAAREVRIDVYYDANALHASVADDGIGIDPVRLQTLPSERGGFGLFTIRERLVAIGGTLGVAGSASGGAKLTVTVPYAS
jgi:signal transduction histidine kinase